MEPTALGDQIRSLRTNKKISLREFARRIEISPSFLCEIETGRSYPSAEVLGRVAGKLGVAVGSLEKLDARSQLIGLKRLLENDPAWGAVFEEIARSGNDGGLKPFQLLKKLRSK